MSQAELNVLGQKRSRDPSPAPSLARNDDDKGIQRMSKQQRLLIKNHRIMLISYLLFTAKRLFLSSLPCLSTVKEWKMQYESGNNSLLNDHNVDGGDSNYNWEVMEQRANISTISDVRQLKCDDAERFNKGKTIEQ
ncbi:7061_t:CDS:2 [Funneliformis geosporum]|uniref:7061_t:CDS:1 n=1 Tax=Funneliformis geosporum TaxID=1117311 RepID=A0A9W4SJ35_9GLOM|nr:7061_t:CDS:2 [Funneliformis geosporum]